MTSPQEEFTLLMQRVRTGCPDAARRVFDDYGGHVLRVVRRRLHERLRSQFDSLDFSQDVWASFFAVPPDRFTFDSPGELVRFLCRMAHHKVVEVFRQRFRGHKHQLDAERPLGATTAGGPPLDPPVADPTPSQCAIANEHWERMLAGQPDDFRRVLELLRQGHTQKEIAQRLALHPKRIQRLLSQLTRRVGLK
jgi:RNA polymerase sigma-70 factor (ECF subfamily)